MMGLLSNKKLHVFTLFAFAVAQPLYDLLGKNAEFFPVRNNGVADILMLVLSLSVLLPLLLVLVDYVLSKINQKVSVIFHIITFSVLTLLILLPLFKYPITLYPKLSALVLIGSVAALTYSYFRKEPVRLFVAYLSPAIVLFPLLFLFNSQVYQLLFTPPQQEIESFNVKATTPIVMLVFDELPISTLMSGKAVIDDKLFPGFASLAENSTWYTNTSTVAEFTIQAVPALLTGVVPTYKVKPDKAKSSFKEWLNLPSFQYYPRNLFTALSGQYELRVFETVSSLCPDQLCEHTFNRNVSLDLRLADLARDLSVVYLHTILPRTLTSRLPRIDMNWSEFVINNFDDLGDDIHDDDNKAYGAFLQSLTPSDKPTLYFHHSTLPHGPWKYLPSGKQYIPSNYSYAISSDRRWKDEGVILEPFQRHVLQTMYADSLLMQTIKKLKQQDLYEQSIIIVTADHGASFLAGEGFREVSNKNYPSILDVPLFIKKPNQKKSRINVNHVLTIDILPTVFDLLNETVPWSVDGKSAESSSVEHNKTLKIVTKVGDDKLIHYKPEAKLASVEWKQNLIGNMGRNGIYGGPVHGRLIGLAPMADCSRRLKDDGLLINDHHFKEVDLNSAKLPSSIKIKSPFDQLNDNEVLAIALNNKLATVLEQNRVAEDNGFIYAMIDDRLFISGENKLEFYAMASDGTCYR